MSATDGQITRRNDGVELTFERRLRHPVQAVWDALTDPDQRAVWFFVGILEPRIGGTVDLADSAQGVAGTVTAVESPHLLEFSWTSLDAPTSTVRFELSPTDDGTLLVFRHCTDLSSRPVNLLAGWHYIFDDLPPFLDGRTPAEESGRFQQLRAAYAANIADDGPTGG